MEVVGSCGNKLGVVDAVEGDRIKLTKHDSPDGQHHFVPSSWVTKVDNHVHLSKTAAKRRKNGRLRNADSGRFGVVEHYHPTPTRFNSRRFRASRPVEMSDQSKVCDFATRD